MSTRMGYSGGLANWRLLSGRRLTDRLRSEECTYRRPTANSGRWGISTLRDRVCMTAAMLVLEPIFEADLPPEIAYRPGRNAQQASGKRLRRAPGNGFPDARDERPQTTSGRASFLTETVNGPTRPLRTAENPGCSAETGKIRVARDCVVGLGGLEPTTRSL